MAALATVTTSERPATKKAGKKKKADSNISRINEKEEEIEKEIRPQHRKQKQLQQKKAVA